MKTESEKFVSERIDSWRKLSKLLRSFSGKSWKKLDNTEALEFPKLYRKTCSDLAEAKTLRLSPDVLDYLNSIVGVAHRALYRLPPVKASQIKRFFQYDMAEAVRVNWRFALSSALFFLVPFFFAVFTILYNPNYASLIISQNILDYTGS